MPQLIQKPSLGVLMLQSLVVLKWLSSVIAQTVAELTSKTVLT